MIMIIDRLIELQGSNGMRSNFIVFIVWLGVIQFFQVSLFSFTRASSSLLHHHVSFSPFEKSKVSFAATFNSAFKSSQVSVSVRSPNFSWNLARYSGSFSLKVRMRGTGFEGLGNFESVAKSATTILC